ncbi:MAG: carboxypeptidase-like regulatory domain-containing protein, partial [Draconibacterium sp.]
MKLTAILLLVGLMQVSATVYSQATKFNFRAQNKQIVEVLKEIEESSDFRFIYIREQVDVERSVSLKAKDATVEEILDEIFEGQHISYEVMQDNLILLSSATNNMAKLEAVATLQQKSVSGKVTDESGTPLPGVTVVVKGTTQGTVTNADGEYSLANIPEDATLQFSFVGMKMQEIGIGSQTTVGVTMEEETIGLEEVVAVGYGTMKRSSVTGSISRVDSEQMEGFPSVNVMDAMQGQAAGVYIKPSRQPGESSSIRIRGSRSLSAGNNPLIIVDGMPGSWDNLVSQDIESMEILKDAAATAIYGSRASNGVVLVTTKSAAKGVSKLNIEIGSYIGINKYNFIKMQSAEKYAELIRDVMRYQTHGVMDQELWKNSPIDTQKGMEMFHSTWATNYYEKGINFDWQDAIFDNNSF